MNFFMRSIPEFKNLRRKQNGLFNCQEISGNRKAGMRLGMVYKEGEGFDVISINEIKLVF